MLPVVANAIYLWTGSQNSKMRYICEYICGQAAEEFAEFRNVVQHGI